MSLMERYLSEIARRLPKREREDVRRELRSALSDALEGRVEGEATEDQVVELLREFGSPDAVAASYRPESQYLIGPVLYPTFKTVTGVVVAVLMSLVAVGFAIDLAVDPPQGSRILVRLFELLTGIWDTALAAFAIVGNRTSLMPLSRSTPITTSAQVKPTSATWSNTSKEAGT